MVEKTPNLYYTIGMANDEEPVEQALLPFFVVGSHYIWSVSTIAPRKPSIA